MGVEFGVGGLFGITSWFAVGSATTEFDTRQVERFGMSPTFCKWKARDKLSVIGLASTPRVKVDHSTTPYLYSDNSQMLSIAQRKIFQASLRPIFQSFSRSNVTSYTPPYTVQQRRTMADIQKIHTEKAFPGTNHSQLTSREHKLIITFHSRRALRNSPFSRRKSPI